MTKTSLAIAAALALTVAGASALADELPKPLKHSKAGNLGKILTGPNGMTLYTFASDKEPGKSACNGPCAENWPPFRPELNVPAPKAPLSIITRDDGSKQYAWKGKPLYYWKNDKKAGDTTGHKMRDVWFVAQP
jgi:predicted lipoprotein with Yx(FWY)xxD motif